MTRAGSSIPLARFFRLVYQKTLNDFSSCWVCAFCFRSREAQYAYFTGDCAAAPGGGETVTVLHGQLGIIGSDNGLSPERRQVIIWTMLRSTDNMNWEIAFKCKRQSGEWDVIRHVSVAAINGRSVKSSHCNSYEDRAMYVLADQFPTAFPIWWVHGTEASSVTGGFATQSVRNADLWCSFLFLTWKSC